MVEGGVWQGSRLKEGGKWALLGTTMCPAYSEKEYEHGNREELLKKYPDAGFMAKSVAPMALEPPTPILIRNSKFLDQAFLDTIIRTDIRYLESFFLELGNKSNIWSYMAGGSATGEYNMFHRGLLEILRKSSRNK